MLEAYTRAILGNWGVLFPADEVVPKYYFHTPTRSDDMLVVSLPIGGPSGLRSRHLVEDLSSWMLWRHFPVDYRADLEEGLTECIDANGGPRTSWRRPSGFVLLGPVPDWMKQAIQHAQKV